MAKLIAEMATQAAAEVLCGELLRRGLEPTALEVLEGGGEAIIVLTIHEEWAKGFTIPRHQLVPEVIEEKLEAWKAKVRADLRDGRPSTVVRNAIQRFGSERVEIALKPRATMQ